MSVFNQANLKLRIILACMAVIAGVLSFFSKPIGLGFLLSEGLAVLIYENNVRYWNRVVDGGSAHRGTGIFHFMINYGLMAGIMILAVYVPWLNIFACALGLSSMKLALVIQELAGI